MTPKEKPSWPVAAANDGKIRATPVSRAANDEGIAIAGESPARVPGNGVNEGNHWNLKGSEREWQRL